MRPDPHLGRLSALPRHGPDDGTASDAPAGAEAELGPGVTSDGARADPGPAGTDAVGGLPQGAAGYAPLAEDLIRAWADLDAARLLSPILDLIPSPAEASRPLRALDLGAGDGRDVAFLAEQGWQATAVEPVAAFRQAGQARDPRPNWLDDALPDLPRLQDESFDLILLIGVWQHLQRVERARLIARLRDLCRPGGRLMISIRLGPAAEGRPVVQSDPAEVREAFARAGFALLRETDRGSIQPGNQARGVRWTWLALSERRADDDLRHWHRLIAADAAGRSPRPPRSGC